MSALPLDTFFAAKNRGVFMLGKYANPALLDIGAWKDAKLTLAVEEDSIPDLTTPVGGKYESSDNITGISISFTAYNWNTAMLERILYGTNTAVASGAITDEVVTVFAGDVNYLVRLNYIADTAQTFTVKSFDGVTTYTAGTDYVKHNSGLEIVAGGAIEVAADADPDNTIQLKVSYTKKKEDVLEAFTNTGEFLTGRFVLQNAARSNNLELCDLWKIKVKPPKDIPLLDQNYKEIPMEIELLRDTTKGSGVSAYYRLARESA